MEPGLIISLILFVLLIVAGIATIPILIRAAKDAKSSLKTADIPNSDLVFAKLSYSDEEWTEVYQREFVADTKGDGMLDDYSGIVKTDTYKHELDAPTIFFLPKKIYISDGRSGKLFTLSDVNEFGYGIWLYSVEEVNVITSSRLRIRGEFRSRLPGLGPHNVPLDYEIPLPATDTAELKSIVERYDQLIKKQGSPHGDN